MADDGGYEALFTAERGTALRLAYVLTGDAAAAEDVVAEAFARMYPAWRRGRIDNAAAYLRRVIVNVARGRGRKLALRRRFDVAAPVAVSGSVDVGVADRELVRRALAALPPSQRAVVVLRVMDDRSESEAAAALGISTGAVKAHLSRGLERLRAALTEGARDE